MRNENTWPAAVLADDLADAPGGVPLVLTVDDEGKVRLEPAPPGCDVARIAAWTTRPAGGPTAAVSGGRVSGALLFRTIEGAPYAPPGHAVWYRPAAAMLTLERGDDGVLAGLVRGYRWTLPLAGHDGEYEFRIEAAGGRVDLINGGGGIAPTPGQDRMVVNTGGEVLLVRAGNSTEDEDLGPLLPGEGCRWTYFGQQDGRHVWRESGLFAIACNALIATDVLRDSGEIRPMPASETIRALGELRDELTAKIAASFAVGGPVHIGGMVQAEPRTITAEDGERILQELQPGREEALTKVNIPYPELARTSNIAASRKTYKWTVADKDRMKATGRRLVISDPQFRLAIVLCRGDAQRNEMIAVRMVEPGRLGALPIEFGDLAMAVELEAVKGGVQLACVPDGEDWPESHFLAVHEVQAV